MTKEGESNGRRLKRNEKEPERSPPEGGHDTTADSGQVRDKLTLLQSHRKWRTAWRYLDVGYA